MILLFAIKKNKAPEDPTRQRNSLSHKLAIAMPPDLGGTKKKERLFSLRSSTSSFLPVPRVREKGTSGGRKWPSTVIWNFSYSNETVSRWSASSEKCPRVHRESALGNFRRFVEQKKNETKSWTVEQFRLNWNRLKVIFPKANKFHRSPRRQSPKPVFLFVFVLQGGKLSPRVGRGVSGREGSNFLFKFEMFRRWISDFDEVWVGYRGRLGAWSAAGKELFFLWNWFQLNFSAIIWASQVEAEHTFSVWLSERESRSRFS